ncbi:hypothetical protein [Aureispira sp. CCB-QB1]|uniref:hypothetical protein n=1 Tax=Aureispira sp. CCB-QB1 TaxID=1313421 RepID=UPI0006987954|nr:hypothetical protein [Aureispira sp. CCB-QB1]
MEKLSLNQFEEHKIDSLNAIRGGADEGTDTPGGDYFFGYGKSTCDYIQPNNGGCLYHFEDGRSIEGECP